jgi:hypothetical protein
MSVLSLTVVIWRSQVLHILENVFFKFFQGECLKNSANLMQLTPSKEGTVLYGITDQDQSPILPRSFEEEEVKTIRLYKEIKRRMRSDDQKEAELGQKIKKLEGTIQGQVRSHRKTSFSYPSAT